MYTQHEPQLKSILDRVTRGAPAPTVCEGFAPEVSKGCVGAGGGPP